MSRKVTSIALDPELLDWLKDVQYTRLEHWGDYIPLKTLIDDALGQYKKNLPYPVFPRPETAKIVEQGKSAAIKKARAKTVKSVRVKKI